MIPFTLSARSPRDGEYAASGRWDLESHTSGSHHLQRVADGRDLPALASLRPGETLAAYYRRVQADLGRASGEIERETGARPVAFAYPFGAYGSERTNDRGVELLLAGAVAHQYDVAFEQDDQTSVPLVTCADTRLRLRRIDVGHWSGPEVLLRLARAAAVTRAPHHCAA